MRTIRNVKASLHALNHNWISSLRIDGTKLVGGLLIFSGIAKILGPTPAISFSLALGPDLFSGIKPAHNFVLSLGTGECLVGLAALFSKYHQVMKTVLIVLLIIFTSIMLYAMRANVVETCGCFGTFDIGRSHISTIIRNLLLMGLIVAYNKQEHDIDASPEQSRDRVKKCTRILFSPRLLLLLITGLLLVLFVQSARKRYQNLVIYLMDSNGHESGISLGSLSNTGSVVFSPTCTLCKTHIPRWIEYFQKPGTEEDFMWLSFGTLENTREFLRDLLPEDRLFIITKYPSIIRSFSAQLPFILKDIQGERRVYHNIVEWQWNSRFFYEGGR